MISWFYCSSRELPEGCFRPYQGESTTSLLFRRVMLFDPSVPSQMGGLVVSAFPRVGLEGGRSQYRGRGTLFGNSRVRQRLDGPVLSEWTSSPQSFKSVPDF